MARTRAGLGDDPRLSDYLSAGVLARACPREVIDRVLAAHGKTSQRERALPAYAVVYYVMALALYSGVAYGEVLRCVMEGLQFLRGPGRAMHMPGKAAISQARTRLSWQAMADLAGEIVQPLASSRTRGAWFRDWRLVSLDGTTLDVADEQANAEAFGYPGVSRGQAACPQLRCVSLLENGTRILYGVQIGPCSTGEVTLAHQAVAHLDEYSLCLADRSFFGFELWHAAQATGSQLLWRLKKTNLRRREHVLADGSYLTTVYRDRKAQRAGDGGLSVRVIEYRLSGVDEAEPAYRLVTTLLDPEQAPAEELAALYHERWEIETALDEFKTHLKGRQIALRSKTPDLVRQEFYGFILTYFAIRQLIHHAALDKDRDPDQLSFIHAVRVIRRKLPIAAAIPP